MHFFYFRPIHKKDEIFKRSDVQEMISISKFFYSTSLGKNKKNQSKSQKGRQNRKTFFFIVENGGGPSFNSSGRSSTNYDEGYKQSNSRPPSDMPPILDELENFMTSMSY